jgi:hypothetical protein
MSNQQEPDANQGPLSPEQRKELAQATDRAGKILGAGKVATFNGWTLGVLGAISLPFGLFSLTALVAALCLLVVAWNEFRGRNMLRQLDPQGPQLLWRNQAGLMSLVIAYCLWSIYQTKAHARTDVAQLEELAGLPADFVTDMTVMVYLGAIALTLLFQGLNARYYYARVELLADYLRETPEWIVDLQKISADAVR